MHGDTTALLSPTQESSADHQPSCTPGSTSSVEEAMHGDMTTLLNPPPSAYWLLLALLFSLPPLILWNVRRAQHKSLAAKVCGLTRVQAHWRARMARKRLSLWRRSATYIQAQSRGRLLRRSLAAKTCSAATYIQAWFRGWLWRRAATYIRAWFLRRTCGRAAATIQRHWRWVLWQSREWRRLSAAAKHIQTFWRTWRQRTAQSARINIERQLEHLRLLMGRCPIAKAIQRGTRRHTATSPDPWRRPQVDPVVATAVIRIQSLFRGWRTRIRAAIACSTQVCLPTHFLYTVWHSYIVAIDTFYGIRCSARSRASTCKCTWVQLCSCASSAGVQASLVIARKRYDVARMLSNLKKACNARQRRAHKAAAEARWDRLEASRLCPEVDAHFEIDPLDGVAYLEPNRLKRDQHSWPDSDESDDDLAAIGYSHWSEGDSFTTWGYSHTSERFTQASTFDSASFEEAATYTGNSANTQTPLNEEADDTSSPIVHAITSNPMPAQM